MRAVIAALVLLAAIVGCAATSEQSFVVVGESAIEAALVDSPTLDHPVLLEVGASGDLEAEVAADLEEAIASPLMLAENAKISENQHTLAAMELLAHQLGAPVYGEMIANENANEVEHIEHSLLAGHEEAAAKVVIDSELPTALLEQSPIEGPAHLSAEDAEDASLEKELSMVELSARVGRKELPRANNYNFLDDPKDGGAPTVLQNLQGLDIYVVNTPVSENDNEIRPVKPPHPMSASMRERARVAKEVQKQLIHDIPQPKPSVAPKVRINTLSAYESSLVDSRPLRKISALVSTPFREPIVGGHGAIQLKGTVNRAPSARFAQLDMELPGTEGLPGFPSKEPAAANASPAPVTITANRGSSFDNRDGPPALLDDLLPLKAQLVEELNPPASIGSPSGESVPNGWGSAPAGGF